jgi:hypothetical protein
MNQLYKYPRTLHLPFSEGITNDDKVLKDISILNGKTFIVTVKMDGENTTMYRDHVHARSTSAMTHPSQHYMKAYWASICHKIPRDWRICGENLYACHSIPYNSLTNFFQVFNIWTDKNESLSLDDAMEFCYLNELEFVPLLTRVQITNGRELEFINQLFHIEIEKCEEGIVISNIESFHYNDFSNNVAKAVRANHVQTSIHWSKSWKPNKLKII